MFLNQK
jgi:hypothetical protein